MSDLRAALRPAVRRLRRLIPRRPGPAILVYHRIAKETFDPWGMAVAPDHFAEQVEWLARNRTVLPLGEFASAHREGKLPPDAAAITFDDGYACTFTVAAPLLERQKLHATVFMPAASLERGGEFWWDELERLVLGCDASSMILDGRKVDLGARSDRDRHWRPYDAPRTRRQQAFHRLWSMIQRKSGDEVAIAMTGLRRQGGETPPRETHRIATVNEVKSSALESGSHGLTHASLPSLSPTEQAREIREGKALLGELIGRTPTTFAFPFGHTDRGARRTVEGAGFVCACGSRQQFVDSEADVFALPRLVVEDGDASGLKRMLSGR